MRGEVWRIALQWFLCVLFFLLEGQADRPEVVVLAFTHERRSPERWPTADLSVRCGVTPMKTSPLEAVPAELDAFLTRARPEAIG